MNFALKRVCATLQILRDNDVNIWKDAVVRVYLRKEHWNSGVLWPFFEDPLPEENDLPIYFRAKNCGFDPETNSYVFKQVPYLHGNKTADVYIPKEYVYGISVHSETPSDAEMRKIGFEPRSKAAGA